MKKNFPISIRVESLTQYIKSETDKTEKRAMQDTDIVCSQNLNNPSTILREATASFDVMKEHVSVTLDPESAAITKEIEQSKPAAKIESVKQEVQGIDKKIQNEEVNFKRMQLSFPWRHYWKMQLVAIGLCFIDAIVNFSSFELMVNSTLGAMMIALAIAGGLAYSVEVIGGRIRAAKTPLKKYLWFSGALLGAGVMFYVLGTLRQAYMESMEETSVGPWAWMFFCIFFFCCALLLSIFRGPSKEDRVEHEEWKRKKKEIQVLTDRKTALLEAQKKAEKTYNELLQKRALIEKYKQELLVSLDKERARLHAVILKEFQLKSGRSTRPHSPTNIFFLAGALALTAGCDMTPETQALTVICDQTESYFNMPSIEDIRSISHLDEHPFDGETIRLQGITEFSINEIVIAGLPSVKYQLLDSKKNRHGEVERYFDHIAAGLDSLSHGCKERPASSIMRSLISELNYLAKNDADIKHLIIFSDLMETSLFDCYDQRIQREMKEQPEKIREVILSKYPLQDLSSVTISIIYEPTTVEHDNRFDMVAGFIASMLEAAGAKVNISANLQSIHEKR